MLWYLVLRNFGNNEKRTEFGKATARFAIDQELLCRLQKIQKVHRLEHSVLFPLRSLRRCRNEKLFLFRKAFPGQSKKDTKNLRLGPELIGKAWFACFFAVYM